MVLSHAHPLLWIDYKPPDQEALPLEQPSGFPGRHSQASTLEESGLDLGGNYPEPCVDHSEGRARALAALATLKTVS